MYDFLFVIIELFSLALTVEALQGKTCQDSLLSGWVGQFEPRFQGEGVLLNSYISSTSPRNVVNFGLLTAEIGSGVWGTPTNFNGFCVLAALLHGI